MSRPRCRCCKFGCPGEPIIKRPTPPLQMQATLITDYRMTNVADRVGLERIYEWTASTPSLICDILADGTDYSSPYLNPLVVLTCQTCAANSAPIPIDELTCNLTWRGGDVCLPISGVPYCASCVEVWDGPSEFYATAPGFLRATISLRRGTSGIVYLNAELQDGVRDPDTSGCDDGTTVASGCVSVGTGPIVLPAYWDVELCPGVASSSLFYDRGTGTVGTLRVTPL